jgi:hypothetical protein
MNFEKLRPIHPFAARMAPEIAFEALKDLKKTAIILDPMVGSGTVLRTISAYGFNGVGFDMDPLAVLMSRVWTATIDPKKLIVRANSILEEVKELELPSINLPWIDNDERTKEFVNFWFGKKQINGLRKLSYLLNNTTGRYNDALKIILSRLIVTKTKGASLAADVSHGRPHRVRSKNDFDIMAEFLRSATALSKILEKQHPIGKAIIKLGDARNLSQVADRSISAIITSPPYLNALDYMRGHKLSLVWLGYQIDELANIRGNTIGAERAPNGSADLGLAKEITKGMATLKGLPQQKQNLINRYTLDMHSFIVESARVLKKGGKATLVDGNSCLNDIFVENDLIVRNSCKMAGLKLISMKKRKIPQSKRYLPSPSYKNVASFGNRMRTESVMSFSKH